MKKIDNIEYSSTFFMIIISPFLGMGFYNLLNKAKVDSIISILIGFLLSGLLIILFTIINNYEKSLDLKNKLNTLFNDVIVKIIIGLISISLFIMSITLSYNINSFMISQFLSETPIIFIAIIMGLLVIYINKKGIETIVRVANLLFIISILLMIIAFIGNYNRIELVNLHPLLINGWRPSLNGGISIVLLNSIYMFLMLSIPKNSIINNKNTTISIIIMNIFAFIIFAGITILTIGSFGIDLTLKYHYPAYIVLKEISIFGFLDKIENFIIMHWIFEMFITLSLCAYFINKLTNIKVYIIVILNIISYTLLFPNSTFYNNFVTTYIPIISIIIIICMILISIKIGIKKFASIKQT